MIPAAFEGIQQTRLAQIAGSRYHPARVWEAGAHGSDRRCGFPPVGRVAVRPGAIARGPGVADATAFRPRALPRTIDERRAGPRRTARPSRLPRPARQSQLARTTNHNLL